MASLWISSAGQDICCMFNNLEHAYFCGAALFDKPVSYVNIVSTLNVNAMTTLGMDMDMTVKIYLGHIYPPTKTEWKEEWLTFIHPNDITNHPLYVEQKKRADQYRANRPSPKWMK